MRVIRFDPDGSPRCHDAPGVRAPGPHEVVVAVEYAAVNPTDVHQRGRVSAAGAEIHRVPGVEVAGRVSAAGAGSGWAAGDPVFGIVGEGGLASEVLVSADLLARRPDSLSLEEAAAAPEAFITAHDAILQGRLRRSEVLLVTGATGGVGMAAVQLGVERGARVLGTARSAGGADLVRSLGAAPLPEPSSGHGEIDYANTVDVVIELVGGVNTRHDLEALAPCGRIVFIAARGEEEVRFRLDHFKTKRATMIGSTLRRREHGARVAAVRAFAAEVVPLLADRRVVPFVSRVFAAEDVEEAFDFMGTPSKHGKVLIGFG